jgi:hypothetical protein
MRSVRPAPPLHYRPPPPPHRSSPCISQAGAGAPRRALVRSRARAQACARPSSLPPTRPFGSHPNVTLATDAAPRCPTLPCTVPPPPHLPCTHASHAPCAARCAVRCCPCLALPAHTPPNPVRSEVEIGHVGWGAMERRVGKALCSYQRRGCSCLPSRPLRASVVPTSSCQMRRGCAQRGPAYACALRFAAALHMPVFLLRSCAGHGQKPP